MTPEYTGPIPRHKHSLCVLNSDLYLFGGENSKVRLNDLWKFNTENEIWSYVNPSGFSPSIRSGHAAASEGNIMIIFGGDDGKQYLNDIYQFNQLTLS